MPILYSLRRHPSGFMIAKFDADMNVAAIYHLRSIPMGYYACECPAGARPNCKHRRMVPIFLASNAVDSDRFYCYETQMWHRPIPTYGEGEASAAIASAASGVEQRVEQPTKQSPHAGEGPEPSTLAAIPSPSPSVSRRGEPAPASQGQLRRLK